MKMKKKLVATLLIAGVIGSLTACSGEEASKEATTTSEQKTGESVSSDEDKQSTTSADELMTPYGKYPEKITITTAKRSSAAPNLLPGDTAADNPMTRYITDKINIDFEVAWEVESSEFPNKLALMIASNDLPDMFTLGAKDYLLYKQLVENDLLADLKPGYDACAGEYLKECFDSYEGKNLEPFMEDGKLLALAGGRYGYEHNLLWLREDWMKEFNLQPPKTIEDIENILTVFVKEKGPQAAMILNATDVAGVYTGDSASPIFASLGAYPGAWVEDKEGNIIWGSTAPEVKEGLRILADWYQKGLIDKQFVTRTAPGATDALFTGGQSGAAFAPWWYVYTIGDFPKNNPEGDVMVYNAPLDENNKFNAMWPGPAGDYLMVSKDFEHPEAIFKVINCEFDMWRQFDAEAGELIKPTRDNNVDWGYMFPTSGFNLEPSYCITGIGQLAKAYVETGSDNGVDPMNPMNIDIAKRAAEYAKNKEAVGTNWIDYYGRYVASNVAGATEVNLVYPQFSFVTESMADLKPNLDTLEQQVFLQIVTGEKPIDAFDQFVADWYAQGGQTMTDEVRNMANK